MSLNFSRLGVPLLSLLASAGIAFGVDPDRTIAQFYHTAWTIEDGAPSGIFTLAQTKDGYLWLGTFSGLFRFDGVRFERYQPERGDPFPSQDISQLLRDSRRRPVDWFPSLRSGFPRERTRPELWRERGIAVVGHYWFRAGSRGSNLGGNDLADSSGSRIPIGRKSERNGVSSPNKRQRSSWTSRENFG